MDFIIKRGDTNVELVTKYMEFGSPLNQAFVIEALSRYANQLIEQKDEIIAQQEKDEKEGKFSMINMAAWVQCAEHWKKSCDRRASATEMDAYQVWINGEATNIITGVTYQDIEKSLIEAVEDHLHIDAVEIDEEYVDDLKQTLSGSALEGINIGVTGWDDGKETQYEVGIYRVSIY